MKVKLEKQTYTDFRKQIENAGVPGYVDDHDDQYIYTSVWSESEVEDGEGYRRSVYKTYRYSYTVDSEGKVKVDLSSGEEVIRDTNYKVVPDTDESKVEKRLSSLEKMLTSVLDKFTPTKREVTIIKQFDEVALKVIEPLFIAANQYDAQNDTYDETGVINLVKAFNDGVDAGTIQPSLFHKHRTKTFTFGKAWYTTEPTRIGEHLFPAYQPLVETTFLNKAAYEARVNGELGALSIGAIGYHAPISKDKPVVGRKLLDFSFMARAAHLAYTSMCNGGAASMLNDKFVLVKQMDPEELNLLEEQAELIERFGENFEALLKQKAKDSEEAAPSTSTSEAQDAGVDKETLNKGNDTKMSEANKEVELQKQFDEYKKAVRLEKSLAKYNLGDEATEELAGVLAKLDDCSVITKSLDLLAAKVAEQQVELAKQAEVEKVEVKTALAVKVEKELAGHSEDEKPETEVPIEVSINKSLKERLAKIDAENK